MTDCDKVKENISDYIEKRLSPNLKSEIENHFQLCTDCRLIMERIPKVQALMGNLASIKCSDNFNLKLREKLVNIENEPLVSKDSIKRISYGFSFAIIIFLIVFGFNFYNQPNSDSNILLPQVQNQESVTPGNQANQNIQQASSNLTQTEEFNVRTKDAEGIYTDSTKNKLSEEKNPRVKYVDSK